MATLMKQSIWCNQNIVLADLKNIVYKLLKSIYGLKQVSRPSYHKFHQIIFSFGFKMNLVHDYAHHKFSGIKYIFLVLYVDGILLSTNEIDMLHNVRAFY